MGVFGGRGSGGRQSFAMPFAWGFVFG